MLSGLSRRSDGSLDVAQFVRFCTVGGMGYLINLGVFALLAVGLDVHHIAASLVAIAVSCTHNFLLFKFWTFRRHELSAVEQGGRYLVFSAGLLAVGLTSLELLVRAGTPEVLAQAIVIAMAVPVAFTAHRLWSFR